MLMLKRNLLTVSWNVFYKEYYIFLTHKRACIYENKVRLLMECRIITELSFLQIVSAPNG